MSFSSPIALFLLILLPYFVWLGRPRSERKQQRSWISLVLRSAILILLVLGLAGIQLVWNSDDLAVVFLIDASDSIEDEQADQAEHFVRQSLESMGPTDQAAIVIFGSNAVVERPMSNLSDLAPITSVPISLQTDVAEAIRLGLALFPSGSARRLVLLSDGLETTGNALNAAELAAASGVPIDIVPLSKSSTTAEVLLTQVNTPKQVSQGEIFNIEVTAESTVDMLADIRVLSNGQLVYEESRLLRKGTNNFVLQLRAIDQQFARYVVQISPLEDKYYQNNSLASFTEIVGPPQVLLIAGDSESSEDLEPVFDQTTQLTAALEATGLNVVQTTPDNLPSDVAELSNYDSIIMVNVNAKHLSNRKMASLQSYVRDLGGGLVSIGGPESYGMGGYFRTPLEETLPVEMQIKDQERFPSVSIVIVMDRSGSMAVREDGLSKIQLASEGAIRVLELLNDFDTITVIPVDTEPDQLIGPALASNRETIVDQIRGIGAGGGGIFVRNGLQAAADALEQGTSDVNHIILLADGADSEQKEGVAELISSLVEQGTTISTVSIGNGLDTQWLQQMAALGNGRFHFTNRAANLPQIFSQETTTIQRSYLVEERFFPSLGDSSFARHHAIIRALENQGITEVPPLHGYVGTSPKNTALVILESHLGDPLLAAWEYGLGRSVAWTSDATSRWSSDWVTWDGFALFWSNVIRWSIQHSGGSYVETTVVYSEEEAKLTVEIRDDQDEYLNAFEIKAGIVTPGETSLSRNLQQVAPGKYETTFNPTEEGAYLIGISGTSEDGQSTIAHTSGWVLGYSPEYSQIEADRQQMDRLSMVTGGRNLISPEELEPAVVFDRGLSATKARQPIWPWLVGLAVLLLPLDIAVRRLVVTRRDLLGVWDNFFSRWQSSEQPVARREGRFARLFEAKERASVPEKQASDYHEPVGKDVESAVEEHIETHSDLINTSPSTETDRPKTPAEELSLASQLLEKKIRRQEGLDQNPTEE